MVVLEAAAITAGGVAAYKGGKAATMATAKSIKTKLKLSGQEKERKETYDNRKQERKERFSKVNEYRNSLRDVNNSSGRGSGGGVSVPSFNWKSDKSKSNRAASSSLSTSSSTRSTTRAYSSSNYPIKSSSGSNNWWEKK